MIDDSIVEGFFYTFPARTKRTLYICTKTRRHFQNGKNYRKWENSARKIDGMLFATRFYTRHQITSHLNKNNEVLISVFNKSPFLSQEKTQFQCFLNFRKKLTVGNREKKTFHLFKTEKKFSKKK